MFRCIVEVSHHRLKDTFKVYPTYDFACPVVDAWMGVTHALRTNEYADRIPQYHWVRLKVYIYINIYIYLYLFIYLFVRKNQLMFI